MTGGRIKRISKYLDDTFCLTYGDGLSNVDVSQIIATHKKNNTLATLTAVQPPGKFGAITIENEKVTTFEEKPKGDAGWVNGGFLDMKILSLIKKICIIGLGYVGLPLSIEFSKYHKVIGFDTDSQRVRELNNFYDRNRSKKIQ